MNNWLTICYMFTLLSSTAALLYPFESATRVRQSLDGIWTFVREPTNTCGIGFLTVPPWYEQDISLFANSSRIPTPSAYNDLGQYADVRDHVGWVWHQTTVYARPATDQRVILRFGSVHYYAKVYINETYLGDHIGGHLPFEFDITKLMNSPGGLSAPHRVTVASNNTLSADTVPNGEFTYHNDTTKYPPGFFTHEPDFDFFNYAGILRSVYLYYIPKASSISDIASVTKSDGVANVTVKILADDQIPNQTKKSANVGVLVCRVTINDNKASEEARSLVHMETYAKFESDKITCNVVMTADNVELWWPIGMSKTPGRLYELRIELYNKNNLIDQYNLNIGFRDVAVTNKQILINNRPFYCQGFGTHEDAPVCCSAVSIILIQLRGRGFDPVTMTKDLNVLEWLGGNCFRTSHYPYDEARYYEADRRGIAIIDETPAVGLRHFSKINLKTHSGFLRQMILRDKNHPSVIAWSLANEPQTYQTASANYFKTLYDIAKSLENSWRPITAVYGPTNSGNDVTAHLMDILCVNRYYGWYISMSYLDTIKLQLTTDLTSWHKKFDKAVILTEYGAGAVEGVNFSPSIDFSEEYQVDVLEKTHEALDDMRHDFVTGELVWHLNDFMTSQNVKRVAGNRKGVMTRNRQPKMAAYTMQKRYTMLLNESMRVNCP